MAFIFPLKIWLWHRELLVPCVSEDEVECRGDTFFRRELNFRRLAPDWQLDNHNALTGLGGKQEMGFSDSLILRPYGVTGLQKSAGTGWVIVGGRRDELDGFFRENRRPAAGFYSVSSMARQREFATACCCMAVMRLKKGNARVRCATASVTGRRALAAPGCARQAGCR